MNRLQKKCVIVSLGLHLLLLVVFFVGSAFISSRSKDDDIPQIDFIPVATVDAIMSGGGDNTVKAPPAELVAPPTPPAPVTVPTPPAPVVEKTPPAPVAEVAPPTPAPRITPKDVKPPKTEAVPTESNSKVHKIVVNTTPVTSSVADAKAAKEAQAKAAADARRRDAKALARAVNGIRGGVSGSTEILLRGPGGGGLPYANFFAAVKKAYYDKWSVPDGAPEVTVRVEVTIARDGTVISSRIIDRSGNVSVDDSVQNTLDRVKFAAPLPDSESADKRTVTISFNTDSKLTG